MLSYSLFTMQGDDTGESFLAINDTAAREAIARDDDYELAGNAETVKRLSLNHHAIALVRRVYDGKEFLLMRQ